MKKVKDNEILWAKVKFDAKIPSKSKENAGYDIYACFEEDFIVIPRGETKLIPTGLACALNENYYLQLEERGSTGSKGIKRSAGVIDSGYRGEIFVALTNCSEKDIVISKLDDNEIETLCVSVCPSTDNTSKKLLYIDCDGYFVFPFDENETFIYPYSKAICQGIVHIVPNLEIREVCYEELKSYKSERGKGKLGSSGK